MKNYKYYYTCPIKALYMIKEFGVKLHIEGKIFNSCNLLNGEIDTNERVVIIDFEEEYLDQILGSFAQIKDLESKIYVALESEHIFQQKKGDIGIQIDNDYLAVARACQWEDFEQSNGTRSPSHYWEIIMRDNKQFFMPNQS